MTEEDWVRFVLTGSPPIVSVTRIAPDLPHYINANTTLVKIHHEYTLKSSFKHRVAPYHFPMLRNTIDFGRAILDRGELTFFYHDSVIFGSWFQATVKANRAGDEIWVKTFHVTRAKEVARECRRSPIIRPEKW